MSEIVNLPLCPHCLRSACPWLGAYRTSLLDHARGRNTSIPAPERCPHAEGPIPPRTAAELRERLGEAELGQ